MWPVSKAYNRALLIERQHARSEFLLSQPFGGQRNTITSNEERPVIAQPFSFANAGMISNSGVSKPLAKQPQHLHLNVNKVEKQVIRPLTAREME